MMMVVTSRIMLQTQLSATKQNLPKTISIVVDKMHMAGHVDAWCKENCDPKLFSELNKVGPMYKIVCSMV